MLTEDEKKRIREEEIFRQEVQQNFKDEKTQTLKKKVWSFLNTAFALWLLSTIVVGIFGWIYSSYQDWNKERSQNREIQRKLDTEISNRILSALTHLQGLNSEMKQGGKVYTPALIFLEMANDLNQVYKDRPTGIYPEYKERGLQSLVIELNGIVSSSEQKELKKSLSAFEQINVLSFGERSTESGEKLDNEKTRRGFEAVSQARKIIENDLLIKRWKVEG